MKVISTGEVLWDIFRDIDGSIVEILGGAPLNISCSLHRLGHSVSFVTGVGTDSRGEWTMQKMQSMGLSTEFVQRTADLETGTALVTLDSHRHATFVIPRPAAFDRLRINEDLLSRLQELEADWLYFGTLAQTDESNLQFLEAILDRIPQIRGFYDINLREGHWNLPLVEHLSSLAAVIKLNDVEAKLLFELIFPNSIFSLENFCRAWSARYPLEVLCVTLGDRGCAVYRDGVVREFSGIPVKVADTVGAGDAFAAGLLHALSQPWPPEQQAAFANGLGALVASRQGATPDWSVAECEQLIATSPSSAVFPN